MIRLSAALIAATLGLGSNAGSPESRQSAAADFTAADFTNPDFTDPDFALVEPSLRLAPSTGVPGKVALTLDACRGGFDLRIFDVLVEERIAATIFVTGRWIERNPEAVAVLMAHPDLFDIENHGEMHIPLVDTETTIYGIETAGSPDAVLHEVVDGAEAIMATGAPEPHWFRGATAIYSQSAMELVESLGYRVAGYSLNGDEGASLDAAAAERRIAEARDGDVIIAHINQPGRPAGEGVANGILALKARGMEFVHLGNGAQDAEVVAEDRPPLYLLNGS